MKPLTRKTIAALSLAASTFYLAAPLAAHAGSVTTSPVVSSSDAATDDGSLEASTDSVDDSTDVTDDASADAASSSSTSTPSSTSASSGSSTADAGGFTGWLSKIGTFLQTIMQYVGPVLQFLQTVNQYTHWFDGIFGNSPVNGPMGGGTGTGIGGSSTGTSSGPVVANGPRIGGTTGINVPRNAPTLPNGVPGSNGSTHVLTSRNGNVLTPRRGDDGRWSNGWYPVGVHR